MIFLYFMYYFNCNTVILCEFILKD